MTKVIVGLGNPGPRYRNTRHNVGFAIVVALGERHRISGRSRGAAIVGEGVIDGEAVALAQPTTMMNLSGRAVAQLVRAYNVQDLTNLLVVYDDMDLPLGSIRMRTQGSAGGHNGIKSIIQAVGSQEFPRLRIGVSRPPPDMDPIDHVLTRFRPDEKSILEEVVAVSADAVQAWLKLGTEETMNRFNQWRPPPPPEEGGPTPSPSGRGLG